MRPVFSLVIHNYGRREEEVEKGTKTVEMDSRTWENTEVWDSVNSCKEQRNCKMGKGFAETLLWSANGFLLLYIERQVKKGTSF